MSDCIVCGGTEWLSLPNPRPDRSMLSDLRVLEVPLDKQACITCGLVRRATTPRARLFESGYQLYDHAPGAPREAARQEAYADWLSAQIQQVPRSVLDVGCGNGSLLLALARRWPGAELRGLDPSPESVARARAAGIDARVGHAGLMSAEPCEVVVSVNVVEHVDDPLAFMRSMSVLVKPGGSLLLACPDGERPWLELLFVDHLWSFAATHLPQLAAAADLEVVSRTTAPADLGSFQLVRLDPAFAASRLRRASPAGAPSRLRRASCTGAAPAVAVASDQVKVLTSGKRRYLEAWTTLEQELLRRSGHASALACFGIGEAAALLRAYAPEVWSRVKVCVADDPEQRVFGDVPVVDYTGGRLEWPVLLAVRPSVQDAIARRLEGAGCSVIRWDDRISG